MSSVQNPIRITTRRINTQDNMVTIDYPVVKDLESPIAQHRINRSIASLVDMLMREQGYYKKQKLEMLGWYEITPYYMGLQYFPISVYQIQDIIDEEGPLGIMAAGD